MSTLKKVTIYSSRGEDRTIETRATVWGELKEEVENFYDLSNLQPTENITKTTLLHKDAVLPDQDFVLFLRPVNTKSGVDYANMGFSELRGILSDSDKETLADVYEKNWTRCSTSELREYFLSKEVEEEMVEEEVIEEVIEVEEESENPFVGIKSKLEDIESDYDLDEEQEQRLEIIIEEISALQESLEPTSVTEEGNDPYEEFLEGFE